MFFLSNWSTACCKQLAILPGSSEAGNAAALGELLLRPSAAWNEWTAILHRRIAPAWLQRSEVPFNCCGLWFWRYVIETVYKRKVVDYFWTNRKMNTSPTPTHPHTHIKTHISHTLPQRQQSTFLHLCTHLTSTKYREHKQLKEVKHFIIYFENRPVRSDSKQGRHQNENVRKHVSYTIRCTDNKHDNLKARGQAILNLPARTL